jgi:hypothetical protein
MLLSDSVHTAFFELLTAATKAWIISTDSGHVIFAHQENLSASLTNIRYFGEHFQLQVFWDKVCRSLAFVFGVLPLALASGASSGSQHSIGTGVVGGTLTATFLAIFFVPLFYVFVVSLFERKADVNHDKEQI